MTERRETGRSRRKPSRTAGRDPKPRQSDVRKSEPASWDEGERIAKYLARAGVCSRRDAEKLIEAGKVVVNGQRLDSPAFKVTGRETILVDRQRVKPPQAARLWRYHKPSGLVTTNSDPEGRQTVFEQLPRSLPRVITVGRLDLTTEGLLLLTNDGELARALELPDTGLVRRYRARAHGKITQLHLDTLKQGIVVDGTQYAPISAILERQTGTNNWIQVELTEGKKREVRFALESLGLKVNRLIRTQYGDVELGDLPPGAVEEVTPHDIRRFFGSLLPEGTDLPEDAPPRPTDRKPRAASRLHKRRD